MKSFFDQAVIFSDLLQKFSFKTDEDDSGDAIMQVCGSQFIRLAQIQLAMVRTFTLRCSFFFFYLLVFDGQKVQSFEEKIKRWPWR
jgi:hypothetical protein